jgi:ABC-type amino acid transport substrate-binding protein
MPGLSKFALVAALAALPFAVARAQDKPDPVAAAMQISGGTVDIYPKPWPLKNLVKPGTLTVTVTGEAPPGDFVDPKTGELTGFVHDLYLKLGADLGLPVEFVKLPFVSSLPGLKANRFDAACASAGWTTQRLASDDFIMSSPIALSGLLGLSLKGSGIASWAGTKGKRIGGVQGEIYLPDARKRLTELGGVTEFPGAPELVLALQNGQIDFLVTNSTIIRYILSTAPQAADMVVIGPAMVIYPGGLCINPREADLVKAVNLLLANYRADGTLKAIYEKYGVPTQVIDQLKAIGY